MNKVEIAGGLTRDAEYRTVGASQTQLMEMTVAVNGTRFDSEQRQQVVDTVYVAVQVWGYVAQRLTDEHGTLHKGDEVYVVGRLSQQEVEKRDGTKDRKTRVTAMVVSVTRKRHTDEPPF